MVRIFGVRWRNEVICERCNKGRYGRGEAGEGVDYMRVQEEIDRDGGMRGVDSVMR